MTPPPKPRPQWGRWRRTVVRRHEHRQTAADKQAELTRQLRAGKKPGHAERHG